MTRIAYKSCNILTCTILSRLSEFDKITGFNNLVQKINENKVEEKYKTKSNFLPL